MSHVVIGCGAMSFGPDTLKFKSLGGSETAALMLGKALAERGHKVVMFCNLPQQGEQGAVEPGVKADDGVIYVPLQALSEYVATTEMDLFIAVRDPAMVALQAQAKKKVLWMHDIATKRGMQRAFEQMGHTFDEIWTVSEWHRQQVAEVTGYPLTHIVALRNGIVPVDVPEGIVRSEKQLVYAARPERGLLNLIEPGGIMDQLPDYNLKVAMYAHFPEHMRDFYEKIFTRMKEMPNVEFVGSLTQLQLRSLIRESAAYVYPTQFEETSCIIARECIEQGTPFLTTRVGALPETLGECGTFFEDWFEGYGANPDPIPVAGSVDWRSEFADFIREALNGNANVGVAQSLMPDRKDLYWDGVSEMVEKNMAPRPVRPFSHIYSLIQDGDVIPALAWFMDYVANGGDKSLLPGVEEELDLYRPIIDGDLAIFYDEDVYKRKANTEETELKFRTDLRHSMRWNMIREQVAPLPPGSRVLEYGCGCGNVLASLAQDLPHIDFTGFDISQAAVDVVNKGAAENNIPNLRAQRVDAVVPFSFLSNTPFDAVICTEVLEHTIVPWHYIAQLEALVKPGGRIILTVPFGAWEPMSFRKPGEWTHRQHIWQIDREMFRDMLGTKQKEDVKNLVIGHDPWGHPIGNLVYAYDADQKSVNAIDPLAKAKRHRPRQTIAAAIIAYNNEDTILRMLNSLHEQVQFVQIAHGPSTDGTRKRIDEWFADHPYIRYNVIDVPKIEARKFGFDDARNASIACLYEKFDWVLWIDTDEYLSGDVRRYLTNSMLDGYLIAQHHFTCMPRGGAPEIDRPARLMRSSAGYKARGHIHEHFEIPEGGPGRCFLPPDIDIGHTGYVNEEVRRKRFDRNYPFLVWDHETQGENPRKLHYFLWFRDCVHRLRFEQDQAKKVEIAKETVKYYNEHREDMSAYGPGIFMALRYLSEAHQVLGIGVPVKIGITLEDRGTEIVGKFESYEQLETSIAQILKPEFRDRLSRYY